MIDTPLLNSQLASAVLEALVKKGVKEFCVCPGARNAPLIALLKESSFKQFYFFDERAAAFFALGRIRNLGKPVAVITTSGTAVGELLPATMEARYSGLPLILLSADRPRSFRGTGAPQTAEQVGIFGSSVDGCLDLEGEEYLEKLPAFLRGPEIKGPFHINVCFDEPLLAAETPPFCSESFDCESFFINSSSRNSAADSAEVFEVTSETFSKNRSIAREFFKNICHPLVIVSLLHPEEREAVAALLMHWKLPAYFEAISGLREDPRMESFRVYDSDRMMKRASQAGYSVDSVIRIGGVPTLRLWRDLEGKYRELKVLSLSRTAYSGLSRASVFLQGDLTSLCHALLLETTSHQSHSHLRFLEADQQAGLQVQALLDSEPRSEPGMVAALSRLIALESSRSSKKARIYLGNSLPIREWDLAASREFRAEDVWASRGLNGIDGQISTFLGYANPGFSNWALVGDLTALYDLQGPWILPQLLETQIQCVIINNGGGKIFSKMFAPKEFQNNHNIRFSHVAQLWDLDYVRWDQVNLSEIPTSKNRIIELNPDEAATSRFWERYQKL